VERARGARLEKRRTGGARGMSDRIYKLGLIAIWVGAAVAFAAIGEKQAAMISFVVALLALIVV